MKIGLLSVQIVQSEILDWWEDERLRVTSECRSTVEAIQSRLATQCGTLQKRHLIRPRSKAYSKIKQQALSDLEMLSRRLHKSIYETATRSIVRSEHSLEGEGLTLLDSLPMGAAAAGSLGLAAAAASFATATTTFFVVIPVSTISWPLFAVFGASAITLSYFSPRFLEWSVERLRAKYVASLQKQIEDAVFGGAADGKHAALCPKYLAQLDAICEQRMETLT